jgi:hypothetical protein
MFAEDASGRENGNRGSWYLYLLRSRERWNDRLRIVVFSSLRLPHPSSEEIVALPARLSFLYYFMRPLRLLGASVLGICRYCLKDRLHPPPGARRKEKTEPVCTR